MAKGISFRNKGKRLNYAMWGYLFILPFFIVYIIFSLIPLLSTFYYSFFEHYMISTESVQIGPTFIWFENYVSIVKDFNFLKYFGNTLVLWIIGFIPQILVSLLLAIWFTDRRLKIRGAGFFKAIIYMPNLIMASAFATLFYALLQDGGPILPILRDLGWVKTGNVLGSKWVTRGAIAVMNFLMWFGNTTIMLMSGVMGIDESIYEAATIDGAGPARTFFDITMPLLMPIFLYVFITSLIGGVQMFDIPQIFTAGGVSSSAGGFDQTSKTIVMFLYDSITNAKNDGIAGAASVVLFIITATLSVAVFKTLTVSDKPSKKSKKRASVKA